MHFSSVGEARGVGGAIMLEDGFPVRTFELSEVEEPFNVRCLRVDLVWSVHLYNEA